LWPYDREKSLAAFTEAFEFAVQNFKETGDKTNRVSESTFAAIIPVPRCLECGC
jgi:hypothetical protein